VKKFLNDPDLIVQESLRGLGQAHSDIVRIDAENSIVVRRDAPVAGKVGVVSGGGSGHEPMHAGFVGMGMLDAACCGAIFTSPVPGAVLSAMVGVDSGAGVLQVIKNYTGDVLNFRIAAEMARERGIEVASVVVDDDVAIGDAEHTAGRRGTGVTVLLEKLGGALAEAGGSLEAVRSVAARVNHNGRSLGVALTSCVTPASGRPTLDIGENEMEFGVGIHGEPGRRRETIQPARQLADRMVTTIVDDLHPAAGAPLLVFVNGFGGTPLMELYLLYNEVSGLLTQRGLRVARSLVGNYVTSLEMAGASVSLVTLDDELLTLWDAPVHTPALRWMV
jgi:dihydroxyacetone kinase-like protein